MAFELTDTERDLLLERCDCGHSINDHGSVVACWACEDDGDQCDTTFEDLLCQRVGVIVAERVARSPGTAPGAPHSLDGSTYTTTDGADNGGMA